MADKAENAVIMEEKMKETMNAMNEQMIKMMEAFMAKQQQSSSSSQPVGSPSTHQGLHTDKASERDVDVTLPFKDVILTSTNIAVPSVVNASQPNAVAPLLNDENVNLLEKLDQRLREVEGIQSIAPIDLSIPR